MIYRHIICLFIYLKLCQAILTSSDKSFYLYDDGSLMPYDNVESDSESIDYRKSNLPVKDAKFDTNLNHNMDLYKKIASRLQNLNYLETRQPESVESAPYLESERKIFPKNINIKNGEDEQFNSMEHANEENFPETKADEKPTLFRRIKEKWNNVFSKNDSTMFSKSGVSDINIKRHSIEALHDQQGNDLNYKKQIQVYNNKIDPRSLKNIFKSHDKQKYGTVEPFLPDEIKVLKNFVKFVMGSRNIFHSENKEAETKSTNHSTTDSKNKDKNLTNSKYENNKFNNNHLSSKEDYKNDTNFELPVPDSVKLNISIADLETNHNETPEDLKNNTNIEGCPFNFNNMNIEMEFKEENNEKDKINKCKTNIKDMKAKINLNSKQNYKANKMSLIDSGQDNNKFQEKKPSKTYKNIKNSEFEIGQERSNSEMNKFTKPGIHQKLGTNTRINNLDQEFISSNTKSKFKENFDNTNIFGDITTDELKQFQKLIERRLGKIEST